MERLHRLHPLQLKRKWPINLQAFLRAILNRLQIFLKQIRLIGVTSSLDDYEKRKIGIFNQLNFFQLITGVLIPFFASFSSSRLPEGAWLLASLPSLVSLVVLWLNFLRKYELALLTYFIFYPVLTCVIYINGMNMGVELLFVLYGILSVFFFQDIGYMIFSIALSMTSYFILSVVLQRYPYQLKSINILMYMLNQILAIGYIFYGLYLIKRENTSYQRSIVEQKSELTEQATKLKNQAEELAELNVLNNKLFSVISHDLKAPMYALRNFFQGAKDLKLSAREIKGMLPDVINDLNYTTGLMENLLHWAKSQIQSNEVRLRELDLNSLIDEVVNILRLQAESKKISIVRKTELKVYAYADRDMISLVLRNLISNSIKFTPQGGQVIIGTHAYDSFIEVYVRDSGVGISKEEMEKINKNNFYSTNGTLNEAGTGLGLKLCKE
ncbi:MAG TPA: HAMP domain-containing sensor histidine kinase, partial [Chitinophagaceae bacterium]|nr:HAMP domain-containing sensor histidine kinase [Chitinophagaceae bacterium]